MFLYQAQHNTASSSDHFGVISLEYAISNFAINFHEIPGRSFIKVLILPHPKEAQIRNFERNYTVLMQVGVSVSSWKEEELG
jgi:hypothetical protein